MPRNFDANIANAKDTPKKHRHNHNHNHSAQPDARSAVMNPAAV